MSEDSKTETIEPKKSAITLSRRDFLRSLPTLVGGTAWGIKKALNLTGDVWQPEVVHLGIDSLRNPETMKGILQTSTILLERLALKDCRAKDAPVIKDNPFYRPISEMIGEILDSRKRSGKPLSFKQIDGYEDTNYYLDNIQKSIDNPKYRDKGFIKTGEVNESDYFLGYTPGAFNEILTNSGPSIFPAEAVPVWEASNNTFNFSVDLLIPRSGLADRVTGILGPESRALLDPDSNYWTYHKDQVDGLVRSYLSGIKTYVERRVAEKNVPVSANVIFDHCLDINSGNIAASLLDTWIFLKFMARQDTTFKTFYEVKLNSFLSKANEEWFKRNILDEYGKVGNYNKLPHETFLYNGLLAYSAELANRKVDKDLHLLNQIGKPYHAWNIALMPMALPPMVIQAGVAWRQNKAFSEQGPVKTASDFRVALELSKIQEILLKYRQTF